LDLLDEKALVILRGLEELRIIALEPMPKKPRPANRQIAIAEEKEEISWKDFSGSVPTLRPISESTDEPELSEKTSGEKMPNGEAVHPLWKFRGAWKLDMTLDEIDAEVDKMREGWR